MVQDDVDAFGRSVPSKDHRARSRERTSEGFRDRSRSNDRRRGYGGNRFDRNDSRGRYRGGNFDRRNTGRQDRRSPGRDNTVYTHSSRLNYSDSSTLKLPSSTTAGAFSLLSLKSFSQKQSHLSFDVIEKKYTEYVNEIVVNLSDQFFKENLKEEWLHDRYNPIKKVASRKAQEKWSLEASQTFSLEFLGYPIDFIQACSLEPKKSPIISKSISELNDETEVSRPVPDIQVSDNDFSRLINGHDGCTVVFSGIPMNCPRHIFNSSLEFYLDSITTQNSSLKPVRILLSAPTWNRSLTKFERTGYVIMANKSAVDRLIETLKDQVVKIPPSFYQSDSTLKSTNTHEQESFTLNPSRFSPRTFNPLPDMMSNPQRVEDDLKRALELSKLLDELRQIPKDQSLINILKINSNTLDESFTSPIQLLDVIIVYLLKVHFVVYYTGKIFDDESHLLQVGASLSFRSRQYNQASSQINNPFQLSGYLNRVMDQLNAVDHMSGTSQSIDDIQNVENQVDEENPTIEVDDSNEKSEDSSKFSAVPPPPPPNNNQEKYITPLLIRLRKEVVQFRQNISSQKLREDEIEAQEIEDKLNAPLELSIKKLCKEELEGKCRCFYPSCNKLFKAIEFLYKHIKTRHEDFLTYEMVQVIEPYMKKRFDADALTERALPPVELDNGNGSVELRLVKDILNKSDQKNTRGRPNEPMVSLSLSNIPVVNLPTPLLNNFYMNNFRGVFNPPFNMVGMSPFLGSVNQNSPPRPDSDVSNRHDESESTFNVNISNRRAYNDVDTPKDSIVSIDFGVAVLPPVKKRRLGSASKTSPVLEPNPEA